VFDSYFNRTAKHFCSHQHSRAKPEPSGFDAAIASERMIYLAHPVFSIYKDKGALTTKRYLARGIDLLLGSERTVKTNLPSFGRPPKLKPLPPPQRLLAPGSPRPFVRSAN
jgi:hypothetical protein